MKISNGEKPSVVTAAEVKKDIKKGAALTWIALPYDPDSRDWRLQVVYPAGSIPLVDARDGAVRRFKTADAVLSAVRVLGLNHCYWGTYR
jgi:hypothetical protein